MNDAVWTQLITAIHASEHQTVLAITGGGSTAIGQLLQVPGGSRTVLEAVVPYSSSALTEWLGSVAEQSCSADTARAMAMASWMRARSLAPETDPHQLIGVGATASLVSDRPKRGDHRVHVATQTATSTTIRSLVLVKNERDRIDEETLVRKLTLLALAEECEVDTVGAQVDFDQQLRSNEEIHVAKRQADRTWTDLLLGNCTHVCYPETFAPRAVFPGAFNPPHEGHRRMARLAAKRLGCPVAFELSITNVDKPPLDFVEIDERLAQLRGETGDETILLTDAPTFRAKASLFPSCTFVVGADTIARIADPKYYSGEPAGFPVAIQQIADSGCRFLVFGRAIDERFRTLSDLELPAMLRALCDEVPAEEFREDLSSTEIRAAREA